MERINVFAVKVKVKNLCTQIFAVYATGGFDD